MASQAESASSLLVARSKAFQSISFVSMGFEVSEGDRK
jgi:hypothetical protein